MVGEIRLYDVSIPARGMGPETNNEAIYLDLGPGHRPLIALHGEALRFGAPDGPSRPWHDAGSETDLLLSLYGEKRRGADQVDQISVFTKLRGPRALDKADAGSRHIRR